MKPLSKNMVKLRIHMSCLEGRKGLHHCLTGAYMEGFVNASTKARAWLEHVGVCLQNISRLLQPGSAEGGNIA